MLVSWLYGMDSICIISESDMQSKDDPYPVYKTYQSQQTKFLMKYPSDDLFEINRIVHFLIYSGCIPMEKDYGYQSMHDVCEWILILQ